MIRTLLLYAVISVTVVLALAACGSPVTLSCRDACRNTHFGSRVHTGRHSHTRTHAGAHPNYGADSQTCDRGSTGSDEHPNPHTSSYPGRHAYDYPSCHIHTLPNSNCHTRCDCGYNKYAYPHTCSDSYACARHSRTAAGFRGKGQRGNAAVSRVHIVSSGGRRTTTHRDR